MAVAIKEPNGCEEHPLQEYDSSACIILMPVGCENWTEATNYATFLYTALLSQVRSKKKACNCNYIRKTKQKNALTWFSLLDYRYL